MTSTARTAAKQPTGPPGQSLDCLRRVALFSRLSDKEIACFNNVAQAKTYKKGQTLYVQKDPAAFFYVICSGWVKLFHSTREGEEIVVDMVTGGDMVGESAIFADGNHTSSAQIIEDAHLLSIPTNLLKEQIRLSPTLALSMLSSMSLHHRRHYGEIALNAMQNAPQRVGCFLLRLCPAGQKKNVSVQLPYDKSLIASTLRMKGSTFSRALNILRLKTGLRLKGSSVEIDSVMRLAQFVYGPLAKKMMPGEF